MVVAVVVVVGVAFVVVVVVVVIVVVVLRTCSFQWTQRQECWRLGVCGFVCG